MTVPQKICIFCGGDGMDGDCPMCNGQGFEILKTHGAPAEMLDEGEHSPPRQLGLLENGALVLIDSGIKALAEQGLSIRAMIHGHEWNSLHDPRVAVENAAALDAMSGKVRSWYPLRSEGDHAGIIITTDLDKAWTTFELAESEDEFA